MKIRILRSILVLLTAVFLCAPGIAGEGMWLPHLLKQLNEADMQEMGLQLTAEDIYNANASSLKDAIVNFDGICTGSIISENGLLLTNHHCGYNTIQAQSTMANNLLKDGFWAMTRNDELPNPGVSATFIVRIEDVTEEVLETITDSMSSSERQSVIDRRIQQILSNTGLADHQDARIKPLYYGNQYILLVTETYRDVRLVGTPPESIGKFGGDTDNWIWPRHTGDFSLFRIYAGKDNLPADYAPDNIPYRPKHMLPVSIDGVEPGDFTMVYGFPGSTRQYLPSYALAQVRDVLDPLKVGIRDRSLGVMDEYMRLDPETRLTYAPRFASLANSWKKWKGEMLGLAHSDAVKQRQLYEAEFMRRVAQHPEWRGTYAQILPDLKQAYDEYGPYAAAIAYYSEVFGINIDLFKGSARLARLMNTFLSGGEDAYQSERDVVRGYFEGYFGEFNRDMDMDICRKLLLYQPDFLPDHLILTGLNADSLEQTNPDIADAIAEQLYENSLAANREACFEALELDGEDFLSKINNDPAVDLLYAVHLFNNEYISPGYNQAQARIRELMEVYMAAQMEVFSDRKFWPDANSTLRLTYGEVQGYEPRDAVTYSPITYLDGVVEKYVDGDYEFDVHPKLIALYDSRDYGQYGEQGRMPVCFIGTNHTTGGNSGSPAIDAQGNLIGLNFDRAWEGTMSDLHYDATICRNIMVDIRYVLFIIDKFAGAGHLIEEMQLVSPKRNAQ